MQQMNPDFKSSSTGNSGLMMAGDGHPASSSRPLLLRKQPVRILLLSLVLMMLYLGCVLHIAPTEQDLVIWNSNDGAEAGREQSSLKVPDFEHQAAAAKPSHGDKQTQRLDCSIDTKYLAAIQNKYGLEDRFRYLKRYIRFHRTPGLERKSMTRLSQPLLASEFETIDVRKRHYASKCDPPIDVLVTMSDLPSTVNASMFMFGVSTTHSRLMSDKTSPMEEWVFWLTDGKGQSNGAKLILMLLDATDRQLQEVANLLGDAGIDADVYHSQSSVEMAVRYLSLIPVIYNHAEAKFRNWIVLCDDDTFFPYMHLLAKRFAEVDSSVPMYVGTLSEDVFSVQRHGSQAFGGAGVFLSLPMAEIIAKSYGKCTTRNKIRESNTGWGPQGDVLLRKCIYENTDVRLKIISDLWQLDIMGDASGFFEWGKRPLSVHHYRGGDWTYAKPNEFTKVAHTCGEDCILQRFMTQDGFVLSGHSVAYYPDGTSFDWDMVERTMETMPEDKGWNLDFAFGPQRPSLSRTGKKVAFDLQESQVRAEVRCCKLTLGDGMTGDGCTLTTHRSATWTVFSSSCGFQHR